LRKGSLAPKSATPSSVRRELKAARRRKLQRRSRDANLLRYLSA
jgi:hypothetical protein